MRAFGDTDTEKKLIRINKKKSKAHGSGELLDTIVHEKMHADHPKRYERTVRKKTRIMIKRMSNKRKQKMYKSVK